MTQVCGNAEPDVDALSQVNVRCVEVMVHPKGTCMRRDCDSFGRIAPIPRFMFVFVLVARPHPPQCLWPN